MNTYSIMYTTSVQLAIYVYIAIAIYVYIAIAIYVYIAIAIMITACIRRVSSTRGYIAIALKATQSCLHFL